VEQHNLTVDFVLSAPRRVQYPPGWTNTPPESKREYLRWRTEVLEHHLPSRRPTGPPQQNQPVTRNPFAPNRVGAAAQVPIRRVPPRNLENQPVNLPHSNLLNFPSMIRGILPPAPPTDNLGRRWADVAALRPILPRPNPSSAPGTSIPSSAAQRGTSNGPPAPRASTPPAIPRGTSNISIPSEGNEIADPEWLREVTQALGPEASDHLLIQQYLRPHQSLRHYQEEITENRNRWGATDPWANQVMPPAAPGRM
jgi:hypothetical protein